MSDIKINNITNRDGNSGPTIAGVSTVASSSFMVMPSGDTAIRGAGSGRGVILNISNPALSTVNNFITIATTGNALDFGDQSVARYSKGGFASSTRGFDAGGSTPSMESDIEYVTISSQGGGNDFGDLLTARAYCGGASNSTLGIVAGGGTPAVVSVIESVVMATAGEASSFGDLSLARTYLSGSGCQSTTRGLFAGGHPMTTNLIDFVLFSTGGTAIKFGDLTGGKSGISAGSNTTRGVFAGGSLQPSNTGTNKIEYVTLATEGNAVDFGDATHSNFRWMGAGMYSETRGCHVGGYPAINVIQYITIATTGDATDFGDATGVVSNSANSSCESPRVGISMNSMMSRLVGVAPPIKSSLVVLARVLPANHLTADKLPKVIESPVVAMVT